MAEKHDHLRIGWARADLTPKEPVYLAGQMHARVSEGVRDPITATAMALESIRDGHPSSRLVLVSCDLVSIPDPLRDAVRAILERELPELAATSVVLQATHSHTAPLLTERGQRFLSPDDQPVDKPYGVRLEAMSIEDTGDMVARRIADAVAQAWQARRAGAIGFGLGQAVVGHNRLIAYADGSSRMYGPTQRADFSHLEGSEDHSLRVLATYDQQSRLTGLVVNLACPSQVSEHEFEISADFWHDTRLELGSRLGPEIFVLPQCAPAGDQSPRAHPAHRASEDHMLRLSGRTHRQEIATRIADGVDAILPQLQQDLDWNPKLRHQVQALELPRRMLSEHDVQQAEAQAAEHQQHFEALSAEREAKPQLKLQPRWYRDLTDAFGRMSWLRGVTLRFAQQQTDPMISVELHAIRLGEVAFATSPFELYLDYGLQIQARSAATQTFLSQLVGSGTYLPTERSIARGAYGAVPASTVVGPEAGRRLVEWTIDTIEALWRQPATIPAQ